VPFTLPGAANKLTDSERKKRKERTFFIKIL